MEDENFLRCLEANLLSDMTLQGIEQIARVQAFSALAHAHNLWVSNCCVFSGLYALPNSRQQEKDHH